MENVTLSLIGLINLSSINSLISIIPPPAAPSEPPEFEGWPAMEAMLGLELPDDYKEFINLYGTGAIDNFLWVLNPFSKNKYLNLIRQSNVTLDAQRQLFEQFGVMCPYAFYPDANGIFPWGITDNGDVLYWRCQGRPSTWAIVINESRGPRWREFGLR